MYVLGSIGGARFELLKITKYAAFVTTTMAWIDKFKLDGIDLDEENEVPAAKSSRTMRLLFKPMKSPPND
ncbi:hypothetical protein H310_11954 [Aphanomyces invadans]|uniref:GH18 domain-containing protein n=1 Tax=Aphanomyces invadans TaxID=157072 RepID=A0A024TL14_9STRA|nr:hypothetical protein H310_11954 [Aphanomyces invadans]ETV94301.1 hypothetical protein H310_11954 [Aphanomyces invadans]|eukprot:XP_008877063.1 hypothetical protein H310_11954 [Aphanomyces invadans]